jgi:hypothetical protein
MGAGMCSAAGAEMGAKGSSLWQMEACLHLLSGIPGVVSAAVTSGEVDDDKLVAACRVMEEWMCDDATCTALMWLLALPSAGVTLSRFSSQFFSCVDNFLHQEQCAT